jgi:hypothetical protein
MLCEEKYRIGLIEICANNNYKFIIIEIKKKH